MVKIILVAIIVGLVYSQPDLRLTVADWLRSASDFLCKVRAKRKLIFLEPIDFSETYYYLKFFKTLGFL